MILKLLNRLGILGYEEDDDGDVVVVVESSDPGGTMAPHTFKAAEAASETAVVFGDPLLLEPLLPEPFLLELLLELFELFIEQQFFVGDIVCVSDSAVVVVGAAELFGVGFIELSGSAQPASVSCGTAPFVELSFLPSLSLASSVFAHSDVGLPSVSDVVSVVVVPVVESTSDRGVSVLQFSSFSGVLTSVTPSFVAVSAFSVFVLALQHLCC